MQSEFHGMLTEVTSGSLLTLVCRSLWQKRNQDTPWGGPVRWCSRPPWGDSLARPGQSTPGFSTWHLGEFGRNPWEIHRLVPAWLRIQNDQRSSNHWGYPVILLSSQHQTTICSENLLVFWTLWTSCWIWLQRDSPAQLSYRTGGLCTLRPVDDGISGLQNKYASPSEKEDSTGKSANFGNGREVLLKGVIHAFWRRCFQFQHPACSVHRHTLAFQSTVRTQR